MSKPKDGGVQPQQPEKCRFIAVVSVVFAIITLIAVIIIWLAVQPKQLIYSIEHSSINGFNYNYKSGGGGHLNATFHCLLRSKNPNRRVSFYFDKIDVAAKYRDKVLFDGGRSVVHPFYQPVRNVTDLEVDVAANGTVVSGKAAEDLSMERAAGNVKMEVTIVGKIRMKIGVFKVRRTVTAGCGPYDVPFSESIGFKRVTCHTEISY